MRTVEASGHTEFEYGPEMSLLSGDGGVRLSFRGADATPDCTDLPEFKTTAALLVSMVRALLSLDSLFSVAPPLVEEFTSVDVVLGDSFPNFFGCDTTGENEKDAPQLGFSTPSTCFLSS